MTVFHDPDHLIGTFLAEGPTELPDRAYNAVLEQIEQMNQPAPLGPRRISDMHIFAKLAIAAAVLIAVGFAGVNLLPSNSSLSGALGAPSPSPTPTATPTPTPTPVLTPTPRADEVPLDGSPMAAGSHSFYRTDGQRELRVTFSADEGWYGQEAWYILNNADGDPFATDVATLAVWEWESPQEALHYVWPNACVRDRLPDPVGATVGDLVEALTAQQPRVTKPPTEITIDGYEGVAIETTLASDISAADCGGHIEPWRTRGNSQRWLDPGFEQTIWILDVEGSRLVIEGSFAPDATGAARAAVRAMMDSIQFTVS